MPGLAPFRSSGALGTQGIAGGVTQNPNAPNPQAPPAAPATAAGVQQAAGQQQAAQGGQPPQPPPTPGWQGSPFGHAVTDQVPGMAPVNQVPPPGRGPMAQTPMPVDAQQNMQPGPKLAAVLAKLAAEEAGLMPSPSVMAGRMNLPKPQAVSPAAPAARPPATAPMPLSTYPGAALRQAQGPDPAGARPGYAATQPPKFAPPTSMQEFQQQAQARQLFAQRQAQQPNQVARAQQQQATRLQEPPPRPMFSPGDAGRAVSTLAGQANDAVNKKIDPQAQQAWMAQRPLPGASPAEQQAWMSQQPQRRGWESLSTLPGSKDSVDGGAGQLKATLAHGLPGLGPVAMSAVDATLHAAKGRPLSAIGAAADGLMGAHGAVRALGGNSGAIAEGAHEAVSGAMPRIRHFLGEGLASGVEKSRGGLAVQGGDYLQEHGWSGMPGSLPQAPYSRGEDIFNPPPRSDASPEQQQRYQQAYGQLPKTGAALCEMIGGMERSAAGCGSKQMDVKPYDVQGVKAWPPGRGGRRRKKSAAELGKLAAGPPNLFQAQQAAQGQNSAYGAPPIGSDPQDDARTGLATPGLPGPGASGLGQLGSWLGQQSNGLRAPAPPPPVTFPAARPAPTTPSVSQLFQQATYGNMPKGFSGLTGPASPASPAAVPPTRTGQLDPSSMPGGKPAAPMGQIAPSSMPGGSPVSPPAAATPEAPAVPAPAPSPVPPSTAPAANAHTGSPLDPNHQATHTVPASPPQEATPATAPAAAAGPNYDWLKLKGLERSRAITHLTNNPQDDAKFRAQSQFGGDHLSTAEGQRAAMRGIMQGNGTYSGYQGLANRGKPVGSDGAVAGAAPMNYAEQQQRLAGGYKAQYMPHPVAGGAPPSSGPASAPAQVAAGGSNVGPTDPHGIDLMGTRNRYPSQQSAPGPVANTASVNVDTSGKMPFRPRQPAMPPKPPMAGGGMAGGAAKPASGMGMAPAKPSPGVGVAGGLKLGASGLTPFAEGFLLRCDERGFGDAQIKAAAEQASRVHPEVALELAPVLERAEKLIKQAIWPFSSAKPPANNPYYDDADYEGFGNAKAYPMMFSGQYGPQLGYSVEDDPPPNLAKGHPVFSMADYLAGKTHAYMRHANKRHKAARFGCGSLDSDKQVINQEQVQRQQPTPLRLAPAYTQVRKPSANNFSKMAVEGAPAASPGLLSGAWNGMTANVPGIGAASSLMHGIAGLPRRGLDWAKSEIQPMMNQAATTGVANNVDKAMSTAKSWIPEGVQPMIDGVKGYWAGLSPDERRQMMIGGGLAVGAPILGALTGHGGLGAAGGVAGAGLLAGTAAWHHMPQPAAAAPAALPAPAGSPAQVPAAPAAAPASAQATSAAPVRNDELGKQMQAQGQGGSVVASPVPAKPQLSGGL